MDTSNLHEKFIEYGKNAKEWQRKCALLLPEIDKEKIWLKKGFSSIYEYAAKLAGMSRGQVEDTLYILRKIENKPALRKVVETKGINAVRPIVAIATEQDEKFWAEKARQMSHHTLAVYVKDFRQQTNFSNLGNLQVRNVPKNENATKTITMQLPKELADKLEKMAAEFGTRRSDENKVHALGKNNDQSIYWPELMRKFIELYKKDQAKQKILQKEKPEIKEKVSRNIPANIKTYVLKRSSGLCEFPKCHKKYNHLHHINRYSSNKIHDPDQIVALCNAHHNLAHHGLIKDEKQKTENWKVREEADLENLNRYVDEKVQLFRGAVGKTKKNHGLRSLHAYA